MIKKNLNFLIITSIVTILTIVEYLLISSPKKPARAPIETNTAVNPNIKPNAFLMTLLFLCSPPPAKYEAYTGSIGRRQGEMKVTIPSKNAMKYCIAENLLIGFTSILYHLKL